jgi:hypothetical protein
VSFRLKNLSETFSIGRVVVDDQDLHGCRCSSALAEVRERNSTTRDARCRGSIG